jgi:hypothetical protein
VLGLEVLPLSGRRLGRVLELLLGVDWLVLRGWVDILLLVHWLLLLLLPISNVILLLLNVLLVLRRAIDIIVVEVGVLRTGRRRLLPRILGGRVLRWLLMRGTHMQVLHTLSDHFDYRLRLSKTLELLDEALVHLGKMQFLLAVW